MVLNIIKFEEDNVIETLNNAISFMFLYVNWYYGYQPMMYIYCSFKLLLFLNIKLLI